MALTATVAALKAEYAQHGQEHVFAHYATLSDAEQAVLVAQLQEIDVARSVRIFAQATSAADDSQHHGSGSGEVAPLPADALDSVLANPAKAAVWHEAGLALIAQGKVAVILLAGGQGTRLGSSAPKGCYDINLPSHKSLFQLQAERIRKVQLLAKAVRPGSDPIIPWYVMTSGPTRVATESFFKENNYFGLKQENGVLPAFSVDGKILLESKNSVSTAPDGNGGIYKALRQEGVLADLAKRSISYIHAYCVDNCLVKVADPIFIGYCVSKNVKCGAKVVPKQHANESVGVVCLRSGKFAVVEYSEIPPEISSQLNADGKTLTYNAANIVNHFYTTEFLNEIEQLEARMDYHVAKKKIKHVNDAGEFITPTSNNGIKLELFIFDVFPFVDKLAVLETARSEEFSPLKNAPGSKDDSPETSRAHTLAQHKRFIESAGGRVEGDVELSPLVSYAGEGLERFNGITLLGPKVIDPEI
ncbi:UDP-N-acetylglucosamine pyrophosphorylase [Physocladia obscura]|uniref:UDP-N-acetylglucosamine diphosphorylase n=1 Tax=Physocladia obscura TaxID=109957 RepID=A0AAD5SQG6_9FUNG|nr:UDP-N-acetylglucosamine pyrophosphorylase [Physocladia obscura]